jgi:HD superfamily phosphohydrolase
MEPRIRDRGKVFRDPVHRLIRIEPGDDFILELIDTPVFQRLRRIRQLGVSWLTYHGAEHSRFSHSMGVFNFAQRILRSLRDRYKQNKNLVEYLDSHAKELKAAALLHDIGHGPFSHLLEGAFKGSPDHEDTTTELIRDPAGDIATILNEAHVDLGKVAEIIEMTSEHRLIVDIVSSQLDADKMDYLLRDSLLTGVEYGRYDSEWVVRNLCIGQDPAAPVSTIGDSEFSRHRLCLDRDRGLHSAEQLILARLHMMMQVYLHRVTRGYEVLYADC